MQLEENNLLWAIEETNKNYHDEKKYTKLKKFLTHSAQKEFLHSQIPFYYAVQAFPRMLAKLAFLIEDSDARLAVIENLYEEHGQKDKTQFHTNTFKNYLLSLGWDQQYYKNPWVTQWIEKVLNSDLNPAQYASYLAGIEYLYALLSQDITNHIATLKLVCEQHHYAKHATLDWEHGAELLNVAIQIEGTLTLEMKDAFIESQNDFYHMYAALCVPTHYDMEQIHQEKIAFYYSREDSHIEKSIVERFNDSQDLHILCIASGGEHLFELLTHDKPLHIHMIDMNPEQIALSQKKLFILESHDNPNAHPIFNCHNVGKFEALFSCLRNTFTLDEISHFSHQQELEKLDFIVSYLFSNDYLNIVFGPDATQYTKENFAQHFYNIFVTGLKNNNFNAHNIFSSSLMRNYNALAKNMKNYHDVTWQTINQKEFYSNQKYDIINISNIGDWMSLEEYKIMILKLKNNLNKNGCIIARKLLGDYSLENTLTICGFHTEQFSDGTDFYKECVAAYV